MVICFNRKITVLELTVCHETNFAAAKQRKLDKYCSLKNFLNINFLDHDISIATVEVSVLGFISDFSTFCNLLKINKFPASILNKITLTAIEHSKKIYYNRDVPDDNIFN